MVKMKIKLPFHGHSLLILAYFINAQSEFIINNEKTVYALSGSDLTLKCSIMKGKEIRVTQSQWSKIHKGLPQAIAVHHPHYGTVLHDKVYNYSASFRKDCLLDLSRNLSLNNSTSNYAECNQWILQLKNVQFKQSGLYECSFTMYPAGTSSSEINLIVKKSVKPEISIAVYATVTGKTNFTCIVKKAFPKPSLLWYADGKILKNNSKGIFIQNEVGEVAEGFYEMRSLLTFWSSAHSFIHQAFKCMAMYSLSGNETQNISSEEIILPYANLQTTLESLPFTTQELPSSAYPSEKPQQVTTNAQDSTGPTLSVSSRMTRGMMDSSVTMSNSSVHLYEQITQSHKNISVRRVSELTTTISFTNSSIVEDWIDNSGTVPDSKYTHFPWSAIVAALLLFCIVMIILGVRKWCQYQKEILNRPPSFKPPPPPIKYTSIQESDGIYPPCSELENL